MARLSPETPLGHLAVRYLEAALSGDRQSAITRVREALERGTPTLDLYEQVLVAAQREIGVMWHLGEISVPEEHAATDTTRSAMAVLAHLAERAPSNQSMALVGSTEGDTHDVGVRAVADLLELGGFGAVCLGANVPAEDLARACEDFDADLLALSASMSIHLPALASAIELVRARDKQRPRIMVGGPIFAVVPGLGERLGADAEAGSLSEAVERANELLS